MQLLARDIMNRELIVVTSEMDIREAAKLLLDNEISGAPVVDDKGDLTGVISLTDIVYYNLTRDDELVYDTSFYETTRMEGRHLPKGFQIEDCNTARVADVMTPVVHSVSERATLEAISRKMARHNIHRLIVRRGTRASGIISSIDVLRAIGNRLYHGATD